LIPFLDLNHFAETLLLLKRLGIITIGLPRNWARRKQNPTADLRGSVSNPSISPALRTQ
jgi:hypothetical protein